MTRDSTDPFEYDMAISFASEDRAVAEEVAGLLEKKHIHIFRDEYKAGDVWAKDPMDHLVNLYARKARACLVLVSRHYPLMRWTEEERTAAAERALRDPDEYILLLQLDDWEVPGLAEAKGYRVLRQDSIENIVNWLEQKLRETKGRSGPPPQSHDLRSGNVPSTRLRPDRDRT
ncbi:MAG TPA: TIR domain-containing protein [Anaerolineales bacterium]|nr:TIR domain-containing protein [Anaerolineales bacterium]